MIILYKNDILQDQQYALLHNQAPSKEGTPDDIHKVEYSEVNTSPEIIQGAYLYISQ